MQVFGFAQNIAKIPIVATCMVKIWKSPWARQTLNDNFVIELECEWRVNSLPDKTYQTWANISSDNP